MIALGTIGVPSPALASASGDEVTVESLFSSLVVAPENNEGYDRGLFKHWVDADGDGLVK